MNKETRQERESREEIFRNRLHYSLPTRIGYWVDELAARDEKEYIIHFKRKKGQLLSQKAHKMFQNLLAPVELDIFPPFIQFGKFYQIRTFEVVDITPCEKEIRRTLYLSGLITELEIDVIQHFDHGCTLTASPMDLPCVRNSFTFIDCDNPKREGFVQYGEDVYIKIISNLGWPLYLSSETERLDTLGEHLSVRLSQTLNIYCRFKILHWQQELRVELTGSPVEHNAYIMLQHVASGKFLACEFNKTIPTFFGLEHAVSCHTFLNGAKNETAENFWKISGTIQPSTKIC